MLSFIKKSVPRWVILLVDILITVLSLFCAYAIRFDFFSSSKQLIAELSQLVYVLPIFIGIRTIFFFTGKTFAGVIRYTSIEDTRRIFKAIVLGTLTIIVASIFRFYFIDGLYLLPRPIIAIEFLLTLFLMLASRIAVKLIYFESKRDKSEEKSVIIYGAGEMGLITMQTYKNNSNEPFKIIAFIDDDKKKAGKILNGVPIHHTSSLDSLLGKKDVHQVILAILNPKPKNENEVIDVCLKHKTMVLNVPAIEDWMNGELNIKQIKQVKIEDLLGRDEIVLNANLISKEVHNKVVLVSGAAGSIGSEIVRQLIKFKPKKIIALDQSETPLYELEQELINYNDIIEPVIGDVSNKDRMIRVFEAFQPEIVYHAAAYKHVPLMELNPCEAINTNVVGTKNLAELAIQFNTKRFVLVSTDKAVNPTNVMGASKRLAEIIIEKVSKNSSTIFVTTRFGNVLGSNGSVIPLFKRQIEKGGPLTVTHEDITRYFMTIPEACQLVLEASIMAKGGEIFVFDMGDSVKIIDLAHRMIRLSGFEPNKDIEIKITGLRPGEKLYEELLSNEENTSPTHHQKILIGKIRETNDERFSIIKDVILESSQQNNKEVVRLMKKIIPEFVSNNSDYQALD